MNAFSRGVLEAFRSPANEAVLRRLIATRYGHDAAVDAQLHGWLCSYTRVVEDEISMSTFITTDKAAIVTAFNDQFIEDHAYAIMPCQPSHTTHTETGCDSTKVVGSADCLLEKWKTNSGYSIGVRDDHQGDDIVKDSRRAIRDINPELVYCDQSNVGLNQHVDMLTSGLYWQTLNGPGCRDASYIGDSKMTTDHALIQRRIFNTEGGRENGIHARQKMLHKRHIDRDISETLTGRERGCIAYDNQQSRLIRRVDYLRRPDNTHVGK